MEHLTIPQGYVSPLTIRETEVAIKEIKDYFERSLAKSLHLTRVSAPLFVKPESGAPGFVRDQGAGGHSRGDRAFSGKMETLCTQALRFSFR